MKNLLKTAAFALLAAAVMALTACEIGGGKDNSKNGLLMLLGLAGSGTQPAAADTTAPTITVFALTSPVVTARRSVRFTLDAADDIGVTAYLVSESAEKPAADDAAWSAEKPAAFSLSDGCADKTVYAYAKDAAGNVSDAVSLSVRYVQSGTEETAEWDKKIDYNNGWERANSVTVDTNGNVYVVGLGLNLVSGTSGGDWWIKKFNANGVEEWDRKFDGNNGYDEATSIAIDANGNVYVAGHGSNLVSGTSGGDWWIKKFNANGVEDTVNWDKKIDGNNFSEAAFSICVDANGNVYVAGGGINLVSETSGGDWWIKKFNTNGAEDTVNWDKKIDGNNTSEAAFSICVDTNGNVYVAGVNGINWRIKKFDAGGAEDASNWDKKIVNTGRFGGNRATVDANGNVYVAGVGENLVAGTSDADWWIKKFYGE